MPEAPDSFGPFDAEPAPVALAADGAADAVAALLGRAGLPVPPAVASAGLRVLVAHDGDATVGTVWAEPAGPDQAEVRIVAIAVAAAYRGRGIGTRLVEGLLQLLIAAGVPRVVLAPAGAAGFFERFGFAPVAVRTEVHTDASDPAPSLGLDLRTTALVRPAIRGDMAAVVAIYNDAVAHSTATYDYEPRSLDEQCAVFDQRARDGHGFFVAATPDGTIAGFSTYGAFRTRPGWRFAAEHSVYVAAPYRGRGIGLALLPPVLRHARTRGFHTMVGVVDASNAASLRMHRRVGFVDVGTMREGGYKFDRWLDVTFVQVML